MRAALIADRHDLARTFIGTIDNLDDLQAMPISDGSLAGVMKTLRNVRLLVRVV